MIKEFNKGIYDLFGLKSWEDLKKGPHKAKLSSAAWHDHKFATPSGKYEFLSELAAEHGHNALPKYKANRKPYDPLRLLTPHSKFNIHSQFQNLDWMRGFQPRTLCLHPSPNRRPTKGLQRVTGSGL